MVPSSLKTFANKPFLLLLPAWVCDALVAALIGSLLTFFVRYVVEPEFTDGFGYDGAPDGTPNCRAEPGSTWKCDSTVVLGMCVMAVLCGALLFTPVRARSIKQPVVNRTCAFPLLARYNNGARGRRCGSCSRGTPPAVVYPAAAGQI